MVDTVITTPSGLTRSVGGLSKKCVPKKKETVTFNGRPKPPILTIQSINTGTKGMTI